MTATSQPTDRRSVGSTNGSIDLWPLATYLKSRFGNVYKRYIDELTPEVHEALAHYLTRELNDEGYAALVDELGYTPEVDRTREEQLRSILATHSPWAIIANDHWAAVKTAPSLEQLVRAAYNEPGRFVEWECIGYWLEANITYDQQLALVRELAPTYSESGSRDRLDIVGWLIKGKPHPRALILAWRAVTSETAQTTTPDQPTATPSADHIRAWAKEHSYQVGERGRMPGAVVAAYKATQG